MKKLLLVLAIAGFVTACNNDAKTSGEENKDTTAKMAPDTTAKMAPDTTAKMAMDTTKM